MSRCPACRRCRPEVIHDQPCAETRASVVGCYISGAVSALVVLHRGTTLVSRLVGSAGRPRHAFAICWVGIARGAVRRRVAEVVGQLRRAEEVLGFVDAALIALSPEGLAGNAVHPPHELFPRFALLLYRSDGVYGRFERFPGIPSGE